MDKLFLLVYVVSQHCIQIGEEKINVIREWWTPKTISKVRKFHALTYFYRRFEKNFSTILSPLIECVGRRIRISPTFLKNGFYFIFF